jgi:3'(2'), 5'-bisphosphate nucleotidase
VQEDYAQRRHWELLWIIDPLDGTKEFIKRNGEFTVNIALIYKSQPVLGVVFLPVTGLVYMAASRLGAFRCKRPDQLSFEMADLLEQAQPLPCHEQSNAHQLTVVGSRSHQTPELEAFVQKLRNKYREVDFIAAGSSLKICRVAEGSADIYPRLGPTMEWDTAAGQAIAEQAGLSVLVWETGLALRYNREDLKNPWFVVVDAKTYMETKELYT